jgi:catechol 2,3-dioxygenase-like lactoylglutathione lyase family enzyme
LKARGNSTRRRFLLKHFILSALAVLALSACATPTARSPEVQLSAANPIDLRRTTLVVRDIDKSLALYRDALGMTVAYDQELTSPGLLKANNDFIGMLGLWQFLDQTAADKASPHKADFTPGQIVLLFNSKNLDSTFSRAAAVPGVTAFEQPHERRYPSPQGDIVVRVSMLTDNDGHTIELNQLLSDPRK